MIRSIKVGPLAATASTLAACSLAAAVPTIGGTPILTSEAMFDGGAADWSLTVSSYVYDSNSDLPPGFALLPGQLLFVYLVETGEDDSISVTNFNVGNPGNFPVLSVGFSNAITPDGLDPADRENPFLYGYSGPSQETLFTFFGDFSDPLSTLDPGEWSLVWNVIEAPGVDLGPATGLGGGQGDTQLVPVAIPAPAGLALLGLAGLAGRRRRD